MSVFTARLFTAKKRRRWFIDEVIQTSAMDCGPAALKCLLEGFHIPVSYGRLREACQTSIDGTSMDVIETVAQQLGLDAEQVMLPGDYLWLPQAKALPAIVVVKHANGLSHFVVVWRRFGRWLQIMDPVVGRRWTTCERFLQEMLEYRVQVPASGWYDWATSDEALAALAGRLSLIGASRSVAISLINRVKKQGTWYAMAALDAAARMLQNLTTAGGLPRGTSTIRLLESLFERTTQETPGTFATIPANYWSVVDYHIDL